MFYLLNEVGMLRNSLKQQLIYPLTACSIKYTAFENQVKYVDVWEISTKTSLMKIN